MEFEEAKEKLKAFFIRYDFEIVGEEVEEVTFKTLRGYKDAISKLTKENIESYMQSFEFVETLQNVPVVSSICSLDYREQKVDSINPRMHYNSRHPIIIGDKSNGEPYVEFGGASNNYIYYFMEEIEKPTLIYGRKFEYKDIFDQIVRPNTIKIFYDGVKYRRCNKIF